MELDTNTLGNILIGIASVVALIISIYTYKLAKREQRYADLDSLYLEALKIGLEHPKLRNSKYTHNYKVSFKNEDDLSRYECYAYIVWNICETIYDRRDTALFETWKPVVVAENKLHRSWFENPENHHKFKERFRMYVAENFPRDYVKENSQKV